MIAECVDIDLRELRETKDRIIFFQGCCNTRGRSRIVGYRISINRADIRYWRGFGRGIRGCSQLVEGEEVSYR